MSRPIEFRVRSCRIVLKYEYEVLVASLQFGKVESIP